MKNKLRQLLAFGLTHTGALRALHRLFGPNWCILRYQRVVEPQNVPYTVSPSAYVRPETFREHLLFLRRHCNVIPLMQLLNALDAKKNIPLNTVVITFDDGWRDIYEHAFPLLLEFGFPASVFLTTSFIGEKRTHWTTDVAQVIDGLSTMLREQEAATADLLRAASLPKVVNNILLDTATIAPKDLLVTNLVRFLAKQEPSKREHLLQVIRGLVKTPLETPDEYLSWEIVTKMQETKLITFGSHSHLANYYSELPKNFLREDLQNTQEILLKNRIPHLSVFAYPGGSFNTQSQILLRQHRFSYALTELNKHDFAERPRIIGRQLIYDQTSHTPELFALRLFGI